MQIALFMKGVTVADVEIRNWKVTENKSTKEANKKEKWTKQWSELTPLRKSKRCQYGLKWLQNFTLFYIFI